MHKWKSHFPRSCFTDGEDDCPPRKTHVYRADKWYLCIGDC